MTVEVSEKTKREAAGLVKLYGYASFGEFVEDALRRRVLELKKKGFLEKTKAIKAKLKQTGLSEKRVLEDFDKFYHQK